MAYIVKVERVDEGTESVGHGGGGVWVDDEDGAFVSHLELHGCDAVLLQL